jgi:hypothetical protein
MMLYYLFFACTFIENNRFLDHNGAVMLQMIIHNTQPNIYMEQYSVGPRFVHHFFLGSRSVHQMV